MVPAPARTHRIRKVFVLGLFAGLMARAAQEAPPAAAEQGRMLDAMRAYAVQYVANLPNFLCEQVTRQYQAGKKPEHWRAGDVLMFKLLYSNGEEERNLELVNDRAVRPGTRRWRTPLQTSGEFGVLLDTIFSAASQASFTWNGWQSVRGKRVAAFGFTIDAQHSAMRFGFRDSTQPAVPYHGTVYGDPPTGAIWRVRSEVTELPKELETESLVTTIEYDRVAIGDKSYLLPVQASIWMKADRNYVRNELEFRNYRKFEADTVVKYGSADESATPPPGPPN